MEAAKTVFAFRDIDARRATPPRTVNWRIVPLSAVRVGSRVQYVPVKTANTPHIPLNEEFSIVVASDHPSATQDCFSGGSMEFTLRGDQETAREITRCLSVRHLFVESVASNALLICKIRASNQLHAIARDVPVEISLTISVPEAPGRAAFRTSGMPAQSCIFTPVHTRPIAVAIHEASRTSIGRHMLFRDVVVAFYRDKATQIRRDPPILVNIPMSRPAAISSQRSAVLLGLVDAPTLPSTAPARPWLALKNAGAYRPNTQAPSAERERLIDQQRKQRHDRLIENQKAPVTSFATALDLMDIDPAPEPAEKIPEKPTVDVADGDVAMAEAVDDDEDSVFLASLASVEPSSSEDIFTARSIPPREPFGKAALMNAYLNIDASTPVGGPVAAAIRATYEKIGRARARAITFVGWLLERGMEDDVRAINGYSTTDRIIRTLVVAPHNIRALIFTNIIKAGAHTAQNVKFLHTATEEAPVW